VRHSLRVLVAVILAATANYASGSIYARAAFGQNLEQRILAGDADAIQAARQSGDKSLIPVLRRQLTNPDLLPMDELLSPVRIALARLGDVEQLQQYWCHAIREDSTGQQPILDPFERIDGWYSFQVLDRLLTNEHQVHVRRALAKDPSSDLVYSSARYYAVDTLFRITQNPPVARPVELPSGPALNSLADAWRQWIARNKDELARREPTGGGVDWSVNACNPNGTVRRHR
jgi:hypothetical protein